MSINLHLEQMHKKAQIELRPIPLLFLNNYLHTHTDARTHTLACRGDKKKALLPGN